LSERTDSPSTPAEAPSELWLGFDNLAVPFDAISAILVYAPMWDRRIAQAIGDVPSGILAIVLTGDGRVLPSRRALADLHRRWTAWQRAGDPPSGDT
jgi:hypothetical protein